MKATIKDIAAQAGVSKTTVSFALNNPKRISKETYERVMEIVKTMGYFPNPVARTLTTKRLGALGLLLPQPISEAMNNPHLCDIIRGIGEECDRQEISLTMLPPVGGKIIEAARRAFVDSIVTIGVGPGHEVIEFLNSRRVPFVTIDGEESSETLNIGIDHEGAAFDLMDYILSLGHRDIAILCLKPEAKAKTEKPNSIVLGKRLSGFTRAFMEKGLTLQSPCIRLVDSICSLDGGKEAVSCLLSTVPRPTAIVAMADIVALGAYAAISDQGLRIPEDISIAGFDGIAQGQFSQPTLTTLWQPGMDMGKKAAQMALTLLDGQDARHCTFPYSLERRGSTARVKTP